MSESIILERRVALVTGAGRGIGRAISLALASAGARLIVLARTSAEVQETAQLIHAQGGNALAVTVDVSQWDDVCCVVSHAAEQIGPIDILVNNAGIQSPIGPLVENDPEAWAHTINVNLLGTFHCAKVVLPGMISRRHGKIINLSGGGATSPRPLFSAYAASKVAVVRLTETLAEEVRPYNIQVNAIAPGAVNTRMLDEVLAVGEVAGEEWQAAQKRQLQGGTPVELAARLALFLASDASDGLTGKLISAPHDAWQEWTPAQMQELAGMPWYTLRRIDPHTLRPFTEEHQ
jgi:NAD(P)-dependent dehydrogenase (short-subunit alcohol dehydrogenase family)